MLYTHRARTGARLFHPWFARVRIGRRKHQRKEQASRSSYRIGSDYFSQLTLPGTKSVAIDSARRSSLSPTSSRRQRKKTVPYVQISARYSAKRSAPESSGLYIVPGRKTRRGFH